ncbi:MAG TPA: hypothetical protein VHC48_00305 [Puia sp.]|jgi:hypothetical protein|nr:hypothetical protein [Puia sp.]
MKEIRFSLDDQAFQQLKHNTDNAKISTIAGEALALFNWAIGEVKNGRIIVSMDKAEDDIKEIVTPTLQKYSRNTASTKSNTPVTASGSDADLDTL